MSASNLRPNRHTQFWILQLIGWSGWVLLLVLRDLSFVPAEYMVERTGVFILDALVGVVLSTGCAMPIPLPGTCALAFVLPQRCSVVC